VLKNLSIFILQCESEQLVEITECSTMKLNYVHTGIPYALVKAGFGLGLILLLLVAVVSDYSLRLMVH
jgi:hypothetical protein